MKKLLLATAAVALLAPAAAHAEIKLDLGGYFKGYAGYSDQDEAPGTSLRKFDFKRRALISFNGETTLDNGLTVGYHGDIQQDNNDTLDNTTTSGSIASQQSYLYFSGNWGRFNLGRSNGAAYLLQVTAPSADSNLDGQDVSFSFYNPNGTGYRQDYGQKGPLGGTFNVAGQQDAQFSDKVTYLTPKFNGFQGGVSYTPRYETLNRSTQLGGMEADNTVGDLENLIEASARYDGEFSGVGVHVGGGYSHAGTEADAAAGTFGSDSWKQWNAAANLTWNAFGFGAAYITDNAANSASADTDTWVLGADYTYGAYVFGLNYFNSQNDASDDELDRYTGGVSYTFGPGMQFRGAVAYYDEDNTGGVDNDAWVATVGTDIQF